MALQMFRKPTVRQSSALQWLPFSTGRDHHFCQPVIGENAFQDRLAEIVKSEGRDFAALLTLRPANTPGAGRVQVIHPRAGQVGCIPAEQAMALAELMQVHGAPLDGPATLLATAQVYGEEGHYGLWLACDLLPCAMPNRRRFLRLPG